MTEVTQEDLETLKSELNEIIETRLDSFIDEFVATWNELENKANPKVVVPVKAIIPIPKILPNT